MKFGSDLLKLQYPRIDSKMKIQSLCANPHGDEKSGEIFLELHGETVLQHSPKQDGDLFQNLNKEKNKSRKKGFIQLGTKALKSQIITPAFNLKSSLYIQWLNAMNYCSSKLITF